MNLKWNSSLLSLLAVASAWALDKPADWKPAPDTPVALVVKDGALTDLATGNKAKMTDATIVKDDVFGDVVSLSDSGKGTIEFHYSGDEGVLKGKGATLEAWIKPEAPLNGGLFLNYKFGNLSFKNNHVQGDWLNFPRQTIFVEPGMEKKRLNYYPLSVGFNGMIPLRPGEWNHVALVYDENGKMLRSWINGGIDRESELMRSGDQSMTIGKGMVRLLHGVKNAKLAGFRLRSGVHNPGAAPAAKVYLNQLPWQDKMVLTVDKIDPSLPLPLELMAILEGTNQTYSLKLDSHKTAHLEMPLPKLWKNNRPIYIKLYANGKEVLETVRRYNNNPVPKTGKVKINPDKSLSYNGKKIFPMLLYGVVAEDLKQIAGIGFNSAGAKDLECSFYAIPSRDIAMMQKWNKEAIANHLFLHFGVNFYEPNAGEYVALYRKLPGMLFWYGADEPWRDWEFLQDNYNFIRNSDGEFPVMTVQCREMHMKNTAPTCDIVGCDPYPVPNVSLRSVATLTRNAADASFGLKPVWTVLGCYNERVPSLQEMRCMAIIALANGANGLGVYSWDERTKGKLDRYYAAQSPEVIAMLTAFVKDVKDAEAILTEPNLPDTLTGQEMIHAALKRANGKTYLLLANDQRREEKATLTLPAGSTFTQAVPLAAFGGKESLTFQNGRGEFTLPALSAGLYELK